MPKLVPGTGFHCLAIETSSPRLSLALGDETRVVAAYHGAHDWRHAESLFEGIETVLRRARWSIQSLTGAAVSIGPGSFTGIRIGLAAARALGQSLGIPVVGVSALEIMAAGAATSARWLAPEIDALRGQVFSALYERRGPGQVRRIFAETMSDPAAWRTKVRRRIGRESSATQPGGRAPDLKRSLWISPLKGCYPEAKVLLAVARPRLAGKGPESYKAVLPLYIRQAAAVERRK